MPVDDGRHALSAEEQSLSARLAPRLRTVHRLAHLIANTIPVPGFEVAARLFAKAMLPKLRGTLICPTRLGFELSVGPSSGLNYYYLGIYEPGTLEVMAQCLRPGDTFVDVGAAVGQMTLHASMCVSEAGRVVAFEPEDGRFKDLQRSIAVNSAQNVLALKLALGDRPGEMDLHTDVISPSLVAGGTDPAANERVEVDTLDRCLERHSVDRVRMVKIDVEGFEAEVIQGAEQLLRSEHAPIVCFEHGVYDERVSIFDLLSDFNEYRYFRLARTKRYVSRLRPFDRSERLWRHDNIFALLPSQIRELPSSLVRAESR